MEESKQNKRTASADPLKFYLDSTQEFFDSWLKMYDVSFGKLFKIPAVGPTREKSEKFMKGFSVYANLYSTWIESNINFQNISMEAMRRTNEKIVKEMTKGGEIKPEKYKDFYDTYIETYSETFKDFMKSGHYINDMGKLMSDFMEYQKYNKEMIEENFLKPGNLPTKSDIDEINKELYTLKKTLKDVDQQQKLSDQQLTLLDKRLNLLEEDINEKIDKKIAKKIDEINIEIFKREDQLKLSIDEISERVEWLKQTESQLKLSEEQLRLSMDEISKKIIDQT